MNAIQYHHISTKQNHTSMIKSPSSFTRVACLCIITQHAAHKIFWEQPGLTEVSGKFEIVFGGARMEVSSPIEFSKTLNCLRLCTNTNLQRSRALNNSVVCIYQLRREKYFKSGCKNGMSFKWNWAHYFMICWTSVIRSLTEMSALDQQVSVPCCEIDLDS